MRDVTSSRLGEGRSVDATEDDETFTVQESLIESNKGDRRNDQGEMPNMRDE